MESPVLDVGDAGWRSLELPGRGVTHVIDVPGPRTGAPTVVLLHGWVASGSTNWTPTIDPLSERFRVVAIDHRGHGRGIRSTERFTLEDCADDVAAVLDALGVDRAVLVGYSMGGPIAQLLWQRHRDRVVGMVLCATAADFGIEPGARRAIGQAAGDALRIVALAPGPLRRAALAALARLSIDAEASDDLIATVAQHDPRMLADAIRAIAEFDSTGWIGDVDVPVVSVIHDRDRVVPADRQLQLAELTGAERVHLDVNHTAPFNEPARFTAAVVDACRRVATSPDAPSHGRWWRAWNRLRERFASRRGS